MRRQIQGEMGAVVDQAEKNDVSMHQPLLDPAISGAEQHRNRFRLQNNRLRISAFGLDDEALRAPDKHKKALAIQHPGANPFALAASQPCSLETGMRIEIRGSHPPRLTCVRRHRNRISVCAMHKAVLNGESAMTSF